MSRNKILKNELFKTLFEILISRNNMSHYNDAWNKSRFFENVLFSKFEKLWFESFNYIDIESNEFI